MLLVKVVARLQNNIAFEQFAINSVIPSTSYLGCIFNKM